MLESHSATHFNESPILQLEHVNVFYGNNIVLHDVNLLEYDIVRPDLITGQKIAILGRSGRGKSTLFKALVGAKSYQGNITLLYDGQPTPVKEGMIGYIDQKYTLFRHKKVYNILEYALRSKSMTSSEKKDKILHYCDQWDLTKVLKKYPNELSGGQRQRVCILEKLFLDKHYLILDEPISGLDVVAVDRVKENFELVCNNHEHNTLIFSTHDLHFAAEVADVIYVLGINEEVYNHYIDTPYNPSTISFKLDIRDMGVAWNRTEKDISNIYSHVKRAIINS